MLSAPAKFAAFFGAVGLVLSLVFSLISGNSILHILVVVLACTLVGAGLGAAVCLVLQTQVPEFFDMFSALGSVSTARPVEQYEPEQTFSPQPDESGESEAPLEHETVAAAISSMGQAPERSSGGPRQFGDHIIVDKVKIKNEPRLMAQAIRTLLTKDD